MGIDLCADVCAALDEARNKRSIRYERVPTRLESFEINTKVSVLDRGHEIMDKMRMYLSRFDTEKKFRGAAQIMIQDKMLASVCALVYGVDLLKKYETAIKEYNNFKSLKQQIFYSAPRRGGKTEALAQWGAAAAMSIPGLELCIFSIASRSAGKESGLLGNIANKMRFLGLRQNDISKDNKEDFFFNIGEDLRKLHGYPGAVHTLV